MNKQFALGSTKCDTLVGCVLSFLTACCNYVRCLQSVVCLILHFHYFTLCFRVRLDQMRSKHLRSPTNHELMSAVAHQVISNNVSVVIGPESNVAVERVKQYVNK